MGLPRVEKLWALHPLQPQAFPWLALETLPKANPSESESEKPAVCAKEVATAGEVFATRFSTRHTAPVWLEIYMIESYIETDKRFDLSNFSIFLVKSGW